ncbi:NRDE family protein [Rapidithrix thailandica]|uniref:NRDE family protein n=1 Tax=Rapidithrix thailandica TaxID=413964 RepID=A0AAW9SEH1_9BACT
MCLILFAWDTHPDYRLILAANRDEFYQRPTLPANFWEEQPNLLAGKDLQAGGTWLGMTQEGRFSAITNYRDPEAIIKDAPTRGNLTLDYLTGHSSPEHYLENLPHEPSLYNGFNLLVGTFEQLYYYSNKEGVPLRLPPGYYGLSNHLLNTNWPKVTKGRHQLQEIIQQHRVFATPLLDMLYDTEMAPDSQLPQTGVGLEMERQLSPKFIKMERYGTRCSTVLTIDRKKTVMFTERTYTPGSQQYQETSHSFNLAVTEVI